MTYVEASAKTGQGIEAVIGCIFCDINTFAQQQPPSPALPFQQVQPHITPPTLQLAA
jgi:hypothetical protein